MKNTKSIINSMFSIPEPKGYERDRITKRIKISVFVITILGFVIFGFNVFTGAMTGVELIFLISLLPIQFITLYLLRKGYIIKAGIFEISISAIYLTPLVLFSGGSNSPYIIAYLGISLITGAILGWKAGVIFSVISVLLLGVIGSIGTKGLLPPSLLVYEPIAFMFIRASLLIGTTIMTMVVLYDLQTSSKNLSIKIIELESAEASRKSIETQLETIINTAPSAIISIDENQKIILFNQEAEQIFNYQETEVLGKPLEALLPPGSVEVHRKHIDNFVKSPEVHRTMAKRGRIQGQRKDGSIFPAEGNIAKVGVDGRTLFTVIMRDITERINAEAEIENLGRFPDENPNPVLRASSTGNILYANEAGNPLLESCGCAIGDRLPEKLLELSKKSYDTNEIIETDCDVGEKVFSFTIAPIMNESYVNLYGRDITERKQAEEKLQTQFDRLYALRKIDQAIASSFDKSIYLDIFLDQVTSQLNVDASAVLLFNSATNYLEYAASRGLGLNENRVEEFSSINTFAGTAVRERRMVKIPNLEDLTKEEFIYPEFEHFNVKAYFATPLISKGNVLGVLETFNHQPLYPDDDWFEFYERLAAQVGLALDNSKLFDDIQHSRNELLIAYDATLEGWARALALKDDETEEHTRRVTEMSVRLARHIKVPEKELAHIRRGALLHDMGKIGIPDSILLKEGPLDDEEWEVMKLHPVYARNFLKPINYLKPAIDIPYSHHEKWDGSGYPQGLKGEQIPLAARVFAVIDVWDALSSDRPYRDAWPQEKVIAYLQEQSGKHLDPSVVDAFLAMMNSNQDKFFRAMTHKN